jgi:hypothetical protein
LLDKALPYPFHGPRTYRQCLGDRLVRVVRSAFGFVGLQQDPRMSEFPGLTFTSVNEGFQVAPLCIR